MSPDFRRYTPIDAMVAAAGRRAVSSWLTAAGDPGTLSAEEIRTVLVDRADQVSRFGLRLSNARIVGQLDLSAVQVDFPVQFVDCQFDEPLLIEGSTLDQLVIVGSPATKISDLRSRVPGILGNGLRVRRDLVLSHTLITGAHQTTSSLSRSAAVWLTESEIGGRIIAVGAAIQTNGDRAIQADRCHVTGDIRLIQGFHASAEIRLIGAQLGGSLDLAGCELVSHNGRAMDLAEATLGGSLFITDSPGRTPLVRGRFEMGRVAINGRVLIRRAVMEAPPAGTGRHAYNSEDPARRVAMLAQGASIRGELNVDASTRVIGGIILAGATVDGGLLLDGTMIQNPHDLALDLTHARIGSKISARGTEIRGTVDLDGAQVAGPLDLETASLAQPTDRYCLSGVRAVVHGDVRLADAKIGGTFPLDGTRGSGALSFRGADLHGTFDAERAHIFSPGDIAINLQRARLAGNARLCQGFRAVGFIALNRAVIEGRLRCDGGTFTWSPRLPGDTRASDPNERGVAFEAISATIRGGVGLGWNVDGAVDFTDTHTSYLADRPQQDWPERSSHLTGFTYERYASVTMDGSGEWNWRPRAEWLARSEPATAGQPGDPGPWEQAARTLKQHGDAAGSEQILMAYLRTKSRRRTGRLSRLHRAYDRVINDWFRGYGYRPLRALIPLLLLILAVTCTLIPNASSQAMRTTDPGGVVYTPQGELRIVEAGNTPGDSCGKGKVRCFNPLLYAIDTVIPIVDLKQRSAWSPSVDAGGRLLLLWLNGATIAGWAISSLLVVGLARVGSRSLS